MVPYSVLATDGSYLAVVVDSRGGSNSPARVGRDQAVEVPHPLGAIVDKGTIRIAAVMRPPYNLARVIYVIGVAGSTTEGTKVSHHWSCTLIVEEGMRGTGLDPL